MQNFLVVTVDVSSTVFFCFLVVISAIDMIPCLISLGSNVGQRAETLHSALQMLERDARVSDLRSSSFHETAPVGGPTGQSPFLNGAATFLTNMAAKDVHNLLLDVESQHGRRRGVRWAERTLDLDLLLYGEDRIEDPRLQVPHPRMAFRAFVIKPAIEVAADWIHPQLGWTLESIDHHLSHSPAYLALAGMSSRRLSEFIQSLDIDQSVDVRLDDPFIQENSDSRPWVWRSERERSLLEARIRQLGADIRPNCTLLTNYWLPESLIVERICKEGNSESESSTSLGIRETVSPKARVVGLFHDPHETDPRRIDFHRGMKQSITEEWHIPLLDLRGDDWSWSRQEVHAVLATMIS